MPRTALIAIGGNALIRSGQKGEWKEQLTNIEITVDAIADLISLGYDVIVTHGNGPQVGNILLQNENSSETVPTLPLDACVAESQGQIGYLLQQALLTKLSKLKVRREVVTVLTQVLVDKEDSAFKDPKKSIGPYYSEEQASILKEEKGWHMREDKARGGFRRLVPSPMPKAIIEQRFISKLMGQGMVVIAAGGGGIPVAKCGNKYRGVEAVVDKDRASGLLAKASSVEEFIILTDVEQVYLNFGTEQQKGLASIKAQELKEPLEEGQFMDGSMRPKIEAVMDFLENGGKKAIITKPELLMDAISGSSGTIIQP